MRFVFFQSNWFVSAAELKEISIDKIIDFIFVLRVFLISQQNFCHVLCFGKKI